MSAVNLEATRRTRDGHVRARRAAGVGVVAAITVLLSAFVASNVSASLAQRDLRVRWADRLAGPADAVAPGDPVARLTISAIGLDAIVVAGPSDGRRGPVHLAGTAPPGAPGLAAIEAGRFGFGAFFGALDRLAPGDLVSVQSPSGVTRYRVVDVRRTSRDALDLSSGGDATLLALVAPANRLGGDERIVVRARAVAEGVR